MTFISTIKFTADHVDAEWRAKSGDEISVHKECDGEGYYLIHPDFGCSKPRPTVEAAARLFLMEQGYTNVVLR